MTEIRDYGATSTQVCRSLRALLDGLFATVSPDRQPAVCDELCWLDATVEAAFADPVARSRARRQRPAGDRRSPAGPADDRSATGQAAMTVGLIRSGCDDVDGEQLDGHATSRVRVSAGGPVDV